MTPELSSCVSDFAQKLLFHFDVLEQCRLGNMYSVS